MTRRATIELFKEYMNFSIGHFTIFSASERENLHGHNYNVYVAMTTQIKDDGMSFNYCYYKEKFRKLCDQLDETVVIAGKSKYLSIKEDDKYIHVIFNNEDMPFLKRDVTILPITNVTVEELSHWLLEQIRQDEQELKNNNIIGVTVKVFSAAGQSGATSWGEIA